jgi:acetyl esterase/lipase
VKQKPTLRDKIRQNTGALVVDNFFRAASRIGQLHPLSRPHRHGIELIKDIPYLGDGRAEHLLDVYRPSSQPGPWPVVLYVHGGGFRILSKDTHWVMGLVFAKFGYLVFNISYRLAPRHPFPAALEDAAAAYAWVARNAASYGGDLRRFVVAGESAGANLTTALALCASYRRPESYARAVWNSELVPRVAVPACGILQVSDTDRFRRRKKKISPYLADRLTEVEHAYLRNIDRMSPLERELADPLLILERGEKPQRPLPAFFAPVGTGDLLLDDSRRLVAALEKMNVPAAACYYPRELHAFHAMVFRRAARQCWKDIFGFLDQHMGSETVARAEERSKKKRRAV